MLIPESGALGAIGVFCPQPPLPPGSGGIPSGSMPRGGGSKSGENNSLIRNGNEAGVQLVLMQPFLLSYANEVVFMLTRLVQAEFPKETMEV